MKPARQIIKRAPHRTVGAIHAPWLQPAAIHHESDLEAAAVRILLLAPTVLGIQHQATRITYSDGPKERVHIPDFLVTLSDNRKAIVEVKPERFVQRHKPKFDACAALLKRQDVDYFVCTELHADKVRADIASEYLHLARMAAPVAELDTLLAWVGSHGGVTFDDACANGYGAPLLRHAIGRRLLITDPSLLLAPER